MGKYDVRLSPQALDDIDTLYIYIVEEIFASITADRYIDGIYETVKSLATHAGVFAVSANEHLRMLYGIDVRTVVYKKMTIVYNIIGDVAYVRRVISGSLIP